MVKSIATKNQKELYYMELEKTEADDVIQGFLNELKQDYLVHECFKIWDWNFQN